MRLDFCVACGERQVKRLEHHHLVPLALGGPDVESNLITLCATCHGLVHGVLRRPMSALTRAGLAAARARGVRLGTPGNLSNQAAGAAAGRARQGDRARERARDLAPAIAAARADGAVSLRAIAAALDVRGIPATRGGRWSAGQVRRVLALTDQGITG